MQVLEDSEISNKAHMQTLRCRSCDMRVRIGRFLYKANTATGAFSHCPLCGGHAEVFTDDEETYWESLAETYELPVDVLKVVYSIWDGNEYPRFSDFLQTMKKEAGIL